MTTTHSQFTEYHLSSVNLNRIGFEQNRTKRVVNGDIITNTGTLVFPLLAVNMDKIDVLKVNTVVTLCETRTVHGI